MAESPPTWSGVPLKNAKRPVAECDGPFLVGWFDRMSRRFAADAGSVGNKAGTTYFFSAFAASYFFRASTTSG